MGCLGPVQHVVQFVIGVKIKVVVRGHVLEEPPRDRKLLILRLFGREGLVFVFLRFFQVKTETQLSEGGCRDLEKDKEKNRS